MLVGGTGRPEADAAGETWCGAISVGVLPGVNSVETVSATPASELALVGARGSVQVASGTTSTAGSSSTTRGSVASLSPPGINVSPPMSKATRALAAARAASSSPIQKLTAG